MKKFIAIAALFAAAGSAHAQETGFKGNFISNAVKDTYNTVMEPIRSFEGPIGYPGNTWGTVVYSAKAPAGYNEYRVEGIVEQGVDWFKFSEDKTWKFNTYGAFEYVLNSDTSGVTPVLGMKVNKAFSDGSLDLGLRIKRGSTYLSPTGQSFGGTEKVTRTEVYATYWFAWDLKNRK